MAVGDVLDREERPPLVRFEKRAEEDKPASIAAGNVVYKDEWWVLVTPPYSKDCFEQKAEKWLDQTKVNVRNGRTPQKWLDFWVESFQKAKRGEEAPLNGTSIKNMSHLLTPAQVKTCLSANILTIEDLAQINDQGLRRLGMGGVEMKNKAMAHMKSAKETGPIVMENAALKKQVEQQQATIQNLSDKLDALSNQLASMKASPLVEVSIADEVFGNDEPEKTAEELYFEKFGKKPHHLMKHETILKKLAE